MAITRDDRSAEMVPNSRWATTAAQLTDTEATMIRESRIASDTPFDLDDISDVIETLPASS